MSLPWWTCLALQKAHCILMSKARSASLGLQLPKASLCIWAFNRAVRVFIEEYFVNENSPRHYQASAGEMAYPVKALATKAPNLSSISGLPWKAERTGSHRLASDFLLWHTIITSPHPSKTPKSKNEYMASLSSRQLNEDLWKTSQFFENYPGPVSCYVFQKGPFPACFQASFTPLMLSFFTHFQYSCTLCCCDTHKPRCILFFSTPRNSPWLRHSSPSRSKILKTVSRRLLESSCPVATFTALLNSASLTGR